LDAAFDLGLLLDLHRDPVEHVVEHSRRFACLHHRYVQVAEDLRMTGHSLGEQQTAFDIGAQLCNDGGEIGVICLLFEDHERGDNVQARLDHRCELAGEDLHRPWLDLLEGGAQRVVAGRRELAEPVG
jgi:hypothetical protein